VSELTARVNDEGWDVAYMHWLRGSRLNSNDMVFIFSVGGGDAERNISNNLVKALQYADEMAATPQEWPMPVWLCPSSMEKLSHRTPRNFKQWFGICLYRIPPSK
jgi:hypothetical protein